MFRNNLRHAILEQLKSPPEGFSDVVRSHFFYKRESLIKVTTIGSIVWVEIVNQFSQELDKQAGQYSSKDIGKLLTEVKTELMKIKM